MSEFRSPNYTLDGDKFLRVRKATTIEEEEAVIQELARYVESKIITEYNFVSISIPDYDDSDTASTSILASADYEDAAKLLIIVQNTAGAMMGIFSRSLCLDKGISKGTMIPYIDKARRAGYAVMILRPSTNSVIVDGEKKFIRGSETPENHVLFVWNNIISKLEKLEHICLFGYGNAATLCKEMYLRQMVRSKENESESNKIHGCITINASSLLDSDDALDIKKRLETLSVNMECSEHAPMGYRLSYRKEKLGCLSLSLGVPIDTGEGGSYNDAEAAVSNRQ